MHKELERQFDAVITGAAIIPGTKFSTLSKKIEIMKSIFKMHWTNTELLTQSLKETFQLSDQQADELTTLRYSLDPLQSFEIVQAVFQNTTVGPSFKAISTMVRSKIAEQQESQLKQENNEAIANTSRAAQASSTDISNTW